MLTKTLLHIWGPFYIHTYGAIIALGCALMYYLILKDPKRSALISEEDLLTGFSSSILVAVIGGRLLYVLSTYNQSFSFAELLTVHEGGLSILGATIALLLFLPLYLHRKEIAILPLLDLVSLYAPLLQAISRLGCFFAGCCYGKPTAVYWAVRYTHPDTLAPLNCWIHPTQLYSAISFLIIFVLLYIIRYYNAKKAGLLFCFYIILSSSSRLLIDFLRDDREFLNDSFNLLSMHQIIAFGLIVGATLFYCVIYHRQLSKR